MKCKTFFAINSGAVVFSLLIYMSVVNDKTSKYCNLPSCRNSLHSMCNYEPRVNPNCKYSILGIFDLKNELVKFHNDLIRSNETSEGAPRLEWDDELATIAQRWANQTPYSNDQCRDTPTMRVGQHISYTLTWKNYGKTPITLLVENIWEIYNHTVGYIDTLIANVGVFEPREKLIRTFLFGDAKFIGCGFVSCVIERKEELTKSHLVCNYGPYDPHGPKL